MEIPKVIGIPSGHALVHNLRCQLKFSKAYIQGNGLAFGEEIEQLWAKLRHLWGRVKEMRSENRVDLISIHLASITAEQIQKLPNTLLAQVARAKKVATDAQRLLNDLRNGDRSLTEQKLRELYDRRHVVFGGARPENEEESAHSLSLQFVVLTMKKRYYAAALSHPGTSRTEREDLEKSQRGCSKSIDKLLMKDPSLDRLEKSDEPGLRAFREHEVFARHVILTEIQEKLHLVMSQQQLGNIRMTRKGHSIFMFLEKLS